MLDDSNRSRRSLTRFKTYVVVTTTVTTVFSLAAFTTVVRNQKPHFQEVDVERLNIVEPDGKLRLVIANSKRQSPPIFNGKEYPGVRNEGAQQRAGMIYFNDEGTEQGGFLFGGKKTPQGYSSGAFWSFDQYNQDQAVTLGNDDANGKHSGGLSITDQPEGSLQALADSLLALQRLPDGPDKTQRLKAFNALPRPGRWVERLDVHKTPDRAAEVMLADTKGHPRLRLRVDSLGNAGIEFLDPAGHVTRRITGDAAAR